MEPIPHPEPTLTGSFVALLLYDVAQEIDLARLRRLIGEQAATEGLRFARHAPDYVRFERPPILEPLESFQPASGPAMRAEIRYYDYGVVSIQMELGFEGSWDQLIDLSGRWIGSPEIERWTKAAVRRQLDKHSPAFAKVFSDWLSEDYYVLHIRSASTGQDGRMSADELLSRHGGAICQAVRGETRPLSASEEREILRDAVSYYPDDLAVIGWTAAFLYDTEEGAEPAMQLLEYANTQLLEFRYYDGLLTHVLADVHAGLAKNTGIRARWQSVRRAGELNRVRLEVRDLSERIDNAIKFLSDMFYARLYQRAAVKVGVPDYRHLVDDKLQTAGDLYTFLVNQFNESRAFVLEAMIVFILIIDLFFLFRDAFR